jgi:hypothetical protein
MAQLNHKISQGDLVDYEDRERWSLVYDIPLKTTTLRGLWRSFQLWACYRKRSWVQSLHIVFPSFGSWYVASGLCQIRTSLRAKGFVSMRYIGAFNALSPVVEAL